MTAPKTKAAPQHIYWLQLLRHTFTDKSTIGDLMLVRQKHGKKKPEIIGKWRTLELPYIGNKRRKSCIPTGVHKMVRRTKGGFAKRHRDNFKHPYLWEIAEVDGRSDILIHCGNSPRDTLGCPLIGKESAKQNYVRDSVNTYKDFWAALDKLQVENIVVNELRIKITNNTDTE